MNLVEEFELKIQTLNKRTLHEALCIQRHIARSIEFLLEEAGTRQPERVANLHAKHATELADAPDGETLPASPIGALVSGDKTTDTTPPADAELSAQQDQDASPDSISSANPPAAGG